MPENALYAVLGVFVLIVVVSLLDWLLSHMLIVVLILAAVGGAIYFVRRRNIARNSF